MKTLLSILLTLLVVFESKSQTTGAELIEASINFHDPKSKWNEAQLVMGFNDTRPGKAARSASLSLDNIAGVACVTREIEGKKVSWHIVNNDCSFEVDGKTSLTAEEIEKYNLTTERGLMMRNYYLYLWGLPMKLKDPGTIIDPVVEERQFNGRAAKVVKVTYDEKVGSDIWYFYFDPTSYEMFGYQFYHDEEKGDGEYITLSGIEEVGGMKIPKSRSWYTNPDSTLLGTDNLVHTYVSHSHQ